MDEICATCGAITQGIRVKAACDSKLEPICDKCYWERKPQFTPTRVHSQLYDRFARSLNSKELKPELKFYSWDSSENLEQIDSCLNMLAELKEQKLSFEAQYLCEELENGA